MAFARLAAQAVSVLFPCAECAGHLRETLKQLPVRSKDRATFRDYTCQLHNVVNNRLHKPSFNCSRVNERRAPLPPRPPENRSLAPCTGQPARGPP